MICRSGKFQSPINIEPRLLLFDPKLRRMSIDVPDTVDGIFQNAGNNLILTLDDVIKFSANFSDGPFMYTYRLAQVQIHLGKTNSVGSEHRIDGKAFSAEIHLVCYNSYLFKSLKEAISKPYGVAILAIFAEIAYGSEKINSAFTVLADSATKIPFHGKTVTG
ncbi:carbonic anhydrase-related protein 10-like [Physella acuta]|uniref:carbonic anhydrase-related protein 10-like n=1 Tax=Physella acuta TaxID=109671 RepID=UPI0027DB9F0E|nr:carbonic anhydrase-related protein 10-like [Physella acuta]